jgi:glycosyltransferase involved in cell wall biosynthesis
MSNAMLEAMASGLPIITTRCEGVEELIAGNGIIVEQPIAEDIAAAISQLLQGQRAYENMAAVARERASGFTWSSVARQYIQRYETVLKTQNTNFVG